MKKFCLFCFLMMGIVSVCMAQNLEKKEIVVNVLVDSLEKDKCLLQLDKRFYVVTVNDIQSIDKNQISSIQMYMPGMKEYNELVAKVDMADEKIVCAFCISMKPGSKLPSNFVTKQ